MLATFDLSQDVLDAIKAGKMLFAIDQQQYLQGYLPIVFLTLLQAVRPACPAAASRSSPAPASSTRRTSTRSSPNTGTTR